MDSQSDIDTPGGAVPIPFAAELSRKALHVAVLLIPVGMLMLGRQKSIPVLIGLALFAVGADVWRSRSPRFEAWIGRIFGFMMRPEERAPTRPRLNGATCLLVAVAVSCIAFPVVAAAYGLAMFVVADAVAAIVGRRWGRLSWPVGNKTVAGSTAFAAAAFAVSAGLPHLSAGEALPAVVVATILEALPLPINDNLIVPVVTAACLWIGGGGWFF